MRNRTIQQSVRDVPHNVAHDLPVPLMIVESCCQTLRERLANISAADEEIDAQIDECLAQASAGIRQMKATIGSLLLLSQAAGHDGPSQSLHRDDAEDCVPIGAQESLDG